MTASAALLVTALAVSAGCGLLDTNQPNIVDPGDLNSPEGAAARRIGAIADFAFAKDGDGDTDLGRNDGQVLLSGLMSDEFVHSTTPPTQQEIDQRRVFELNSTNFDFFHNLHRARVAAEEAAAALQEFSPDPATEPGIAEMLSLAGFTYVYFGEDYCSGVPFSRVDGDTLVFGEPQTTDETLATAIARFDAALAEPGIAEDEDMGHLAAVGKARALLNLADYANAVAAVAEVPTEFQYVTEHAASPIRLQNAIYAFSVGFTWSVADDEGGAGLPYVTAADPRVPTFFDPDDPVGLDGTTLQNTLLKYNDATSPVVVADGIEARLIEAEGLLANDDFSGMTGILNTLRQAIGLTDLADPADRDEAIDQLFSERAFWLFATGHRLGDMRRLVRQYDRAADQVFPTGIYIKGGNYGDDVNLPIPLEEQNNPNSSGCLNRDP